MTPETPISGIEAATPKTAEKPKAAAAVAEPEPKLAETTGHADRSTFLALTSELKEASVDLAEGVNVLVRELTGAERADLVTLQAEAYQKGSLKIREYEQKLLLAGVADPATPEGARQPLLRGGDGDLLMRMGASKVQRLVMKIEELSGMGAAAMVRAEGNSGLTPSDGSTSG